MTFGDKEDKCSERLKVEDRDRDVCKEKVRRGESKDDCNGKCPDERR